MIAKSLLIGTMTFALAGDLTLIRGTNGDDDLNGTPQGDVLVGMAGDDQLRSWDGDDLLFGGTGDDFLLGGMGDDVHLGGPGDDLLRGLEGNDVHLGGSGHDTIQFIQGNLMLALPGLPPPVCLAAAEHDVAFGGEGNDRLEWATGMMTSGPVSACTSAGSGEADGGPGHDTIFVGVGSFVADSSDYVLETSPVSGFTSRLRSLETGATVDFVRFETVIFADRIINL